MVTYFQFLNSSPAFASAPLWLGPDAEDHRLRPPGPRAASGAPRGPSKAEALEASSIGATVKKDRNM